MTFKANLNLLLSISQSGAAAFGKTPAWQGDVNLMESYADGVGAGQFNLAYLEERTVASGANDDVDLAGVLASALGTTFTAAELALLFVLNRARDPDEAANSTNLTIGAGSNPMIGFLGGTTPTLGPIRPGAFCMLGGVKNAGGIGAITAGTGDILRIANSAGAANKYVLGLLGRTTA